MSPPSHDPPNCPIGTRLEQVHDELADVRALVGRLTDAVERLTRLEERHANTSQALDRAFTALGGLRDRMHAIEVSLAGLANFGAIEGRVRKLEQGEPEQTRTARWVERAVLAAAGIVVLYLAKKGGLL